MMGWSSTCLSRRSLLTVFLALFGEEVLGQSWTHVGYLRKTGDLGKANAVVLVLVPVVIEVKKADRQFN